MSKNRFQQILMLSMLWPVSSLCQAPRTNLAGRIEPADGSSSALYVELRDLGNRMIIQREPVATDGSFRFRDLASGSYEIRVVTALQNETVVQEFVDVNPQGGPLVLHMPRTERTRPVSGLVSVRELQSHVPKKAFQAFVKAQHYAEREKRTEAIAELRRAIALDPLWRDAHVNLGAELVRVGHYEEAMAELQEALRIGPPTAMIYTNYAAALATANRKADGEKAVREALKLDSSCWRAHYLLGHFLAMEPGRDQEALDHLRAGATEVPSSHIVAAQLLLRNGNRPAAAAELRAYLKSGDRGHRAEAQKFLVDLER